MAILTRHTLMLVVILIGCNNSHSESDYQRDRRFIILGDSNVGFALSVGGSIGSGIISSSKFKGKSFTAKRWKVKKHKYRDQFNDYGPEWIPWWMPPPYF